MYGFLLYSLPLMKIISTGEDYAVNVRGLHSLFIQSLSRVLNILTSTDDMPHRYCWSFSRVLPIVTSTAGWTFSKSLSWDGKVDMRLKYQTRHHHHHHSLFTYYVLIYNSVMNKVIRRSCRKNRNSKNTWHSEKKNQMYVFTWAAMGPPAHATFLFSIVVFCQQLRIWIYLSWWL